MKNSEDWQNAAWQKPINADENPQSSPSAQGDTPPGQRYGTVPAGYHGAPSGYPYGPPPAQNKKGKGWIVALAIVACVLILGILGISSCSTLMGSAMGGSFGSSSLDIDLVSTDSVVVIPIEGTIQYDGSFSSPEGLKEQLDKAENNSQVKAVVLRVDSGGGVATAGEEMSTYVRNFSKPIVVSSASINASAAYEISSQADYIFTAKTSAVGSIGTALQITDLSGLYEKLGINIENIVSSTSKDSSYGNRPLTDEERAYYQTMVDQINQVFIENVAEGRSMTIDQVKALATGLTYTGLMAVENGLVDEVGTLEDACAKAARLANASRYNVVTVQGSSQGLSLLDLLGSASSDQELLAKLKELTAHDSSVR